MAQVPPTNGADYGDLGAFLAVLASAATGAWAWWKSNHSDSKGAKDDPDLASINALKETVLAIQTENERLRRDNQTIWERYTLLQESYIVLQERVNKLYRELKVQNGND